MRIIRRISFLLVLVAVIGALDPGTADSAMSDWPSKNITIIVVGGPGGGFDLTARATAPSIAKHLPRRVSVVVKNITAGAGKIGTRELATAKPDGYTIAVLDPMNMALMQMVSPIEGVDVTKIAWLGRLNTLPNMVLVGSKTGFRKVVDLKGKRVRFAVHQLAEMLWTTKMAQSLGATAQFVNFSGAPEGCLAIMRGDCDAIVMNYASLRRQVRASEGQLIPLLVDSQERIPGVEVPSIKEVGIQSECIYGSSKVVAVPPGFSPELRRIWEETLSKVLGDPEWSAQMNKIEFPPTVLTGSNLDAWIKSMLDNVEKDKDIIVGLSKEKY